MKKELQAVVTTPGMANDKSLHHGGAEIGNSHAVGPQSGTNLAVYPFIPNPFHVSMVATSPSSTAAEPGAGHGIFKPYDSGSYFDEMLTSDAGAARTMSAS